MKLTYLFLSLFFLSACQYMEFSPWQSDPQTKNLNHKNLARILANEKLEIPSKFKIAIVGDTQRFPESFHEIVQEINSRGDEFDFVVVVGDVTHMGLRREFKWMTDIFKSFDQPFLTVPGNHDGLSNGKSLYRQTFGALDFSFDYYGIHFVMWNNNAREWDIDLGWLEKEVEDAERAIVISHQPPRQNMLAKRQEKRWTEIRENNENLEASIHAHIHYYDFRREDSGLPIYVVDDVSRRYWGYVEIDIETKAHRFWNCRNECVEVTDVN